MKHVPGFAALATLAASLATATQAAPVSYTLDPDHTLPRLEINHNGFSNYIATFTKSAGKAMLDNAARNGSVEVTIQTASFLTGHAFMEGFVKGKEFFNVEQFPTMVYKSSRFIYQGDAPSVVEGELTLLGVTKPVTLTFTNFACGQHPRSKKDQCGGNLTGQLKRSDFGMKAFLPVIGDDVKLLIQVEAFKD
ncbi:MAG: YceI family protein [Proteobacteria bacterium]|nr:YceI family protein [Pseudomonadota bacterium]